MKPDDVKLVPNPEWEKATHRVWFPCLHPMPKELWANLGRMGEPPNPFDVVEKTAMNFQQDDK